VNWREAARSGEWAQHFSNASCYRNKFSLQIKKSLKRLKKVKNEDKDADAYSGHEMILKIDFNWLQK